MAAQGWRVTSQVSDQFKTTQAGQTVTGTIVYFITGQGNEGSVFVPDNTYQDVEATKKMISAQAVLMDKVGQLSEQGQSG